MGVDWLRSCFETDFHFFRNAPSVTTRGAFYFLPEGAPCLPYEHYFFSPTWTNGDWGDPSTLGPDPAAPRPWRNGGLSISYPPAIEYGDPNSFRNGSIYPDGLNIATLRDGITEQCWIHASAPFLPFDFVSDIDSCCVRAAYARIIDLLYNEEFLLIEEFFLAWLGSSIAVLSFPAIGEMPAFCLVKSSLYSLVFVSGTENFQQWAMQGFDSLNGPTNQSGLKTLPLWNRLSNALAQAMNDFGCHPTAPVLLAGHSYGGAGTALLSIRLRQAQANRQLVLLTFGMPRPGDFGVIDLLKSIKTIHVHNLEDVVPQIPPTRVQSAPFVLLMPALLSALWNEWNAPPSFVHQAENGDITIAPLASLTTDVLAPLVVRAVFGLPQATIPSHQVSEYIRRGLIRCDCPEWPFSEIVWRIIFPADLFAGGLGLGAPEDVAGGLGLDGP